jgi:hypothetical protein
MDGRNLKILDWWLKSKETTESRKKKMKDNK